ncbi:MAG: hypothetical protein V7724_19070 [Sediminicola sp.]
MARIGSPFIVTGTLLEVDFYVDGGILNGKDIRTWPKIIRVVVGHKKSLSEDRLGP